MNEWTQVNKEYKEVAQSGVLCMWLIISETYIFLKRYHLYKEWVGAKPLHVKGKTSKKRKLEKKKKTSYDKKQDWATCELVKLKRVKHLDLKCNFNVKSRLLRCLYIIIMIKCRLSLFVS